MTEKKQDNRDRVKSVNELLLFCLYGVGWSHVVTGDVTFLAGVDGAGLPPVSFPEEKSQLEDTDTKKRMDSDVTTRVAITVSNARKRKRSLCASVTLTITSGGREILEVFYHKKSIKISL